MNAARRAANAQTITDNISMLERNYLGYMNRQEDVISTYNSGDDYKIRDNMNHNDNKIMMMVDELTTIAKYKKTTDYLYKFLRGNTITELEDILINGDPIPVFGFEYKEIYDLMYTYDVRLYYAESGNSKGTEEHAENAALFDNNKIVPQPPYSTVPKFPDVSETVLYEQDDTATENLAGIAEQIKDLNDDIANHADDYQELGEGLRIAYIEYLQKALDATNYDIDDYYCSVNSLKEEYESMINNLNKIEIDSEDNLNFLYQATTNFNDKVDYRILQLDGFITEDDYALQYTFAKQRINKKKGTFWEWYKQLLAIDGIYTGFLEDKHELKNYFNLGAAWKIQKDTEDQKFIYIEQDLHPYYAEEGFSPMLYIDDVIHVVSDTNTETEAIIRRITTTKIDGPETINENKEIITSKINVSKVEVSRIIPSLYTVDDNAVLVKDAT